MATNKPKGPRFISDSERINNRIYSNHIEVRNTGLDFTISFMDVPPPTKADLKLLRADKDIPVPLQCQVAIPNDLIPSLIEALQTNYEKFQKHTTPKPKSKKTVGKTKSKR